MPGDAFRSSWQPYYIGARTSPISWIKQQQQKRKWPHQMAALEPSLVPTAPSASPTDDWQSIHGSRRRVSRGWSERGNRNEQPRAIGSVIQHVGPIGGLSCPRYCTFWDIFVVKKPSYPLDIHYIFIRTSTIFRNHIRQLFVKCQYLAVVWLARVLFQLFG